MTGEPILGGGERPKRGGHGIAADAADLDRIRSGWSVAERFATQAAKHPANIAVKTKRHELTYADLDRGANRIARALAERRGSGDRVAVLLGHDAPLIVAILGVVKAAMVYVPLDGSFPIARLAHMIEDSGAALIVTDSANLALARELSRGTLDLLNADTIEGDASIDDLGRSISPEAPIYLLYTSGSAGQPKGVVQTHRNVVHCIGEIASSLRIGPEDRITLLPAATYGAAVVDIFGALLNGAGLYPYDLRELGIAGLADWLREQSITVYHSVPAVFRQLGESLTPRDRFPELRVIYLGGESASTRDVELYKERFSEECVLVHAFAGTEFHVASQYVVHKDTSIEGPVVPVGYPVRDVELLLLDEQGQPVEAGQIGEIVVESAYLSPEYWRRPDLTEMVFAADPGAQGKRLYRTGDLGVMSRDGCLQHRGRNDFQVKVRGHRIEVSEIERALLGMAGVKEVAILARETDHGNKQLIAYLVPADGTELRTNAARAFLSEKLPSHMVPASFVLLDALPLTPNGKLDRRALPAPETVRAQAEDAFVAPSGPVEEKLAHIWEQLLNVRPVGRRDDFFLLGGDSLLAMGLLVEVERTFGSPMALSDLVPDATLEQVALAISGSARSRSLLVPVQADGSKTPIFVVHPMDGDVFRYAELARLLGPDQPFYALRARGIDGREEPVSDIKTMAASYIAEIQAIRPQGPYLLGGYSFGAMVALEMAQQLRAKGQDVALLAILDQAPLNSDRLEARLTPRFLWHLLRYYVGKARSARTLSQASSGERLGLLTRTVKGYVHRLRMILGVGRTGSGPTEGREAPRLPLRLRWRLGEFYDSAGKLPWHYQKVRFAHLRALMDYEPQPYPGRVLLFRAAQQPLLLSGDPNLGWAGLAAGGLEVRPVATEHCLILRDPFVRSIADDLRVALDQIERERPAASRVQLAKT